MKKPHRPIRISGDIAFVPLSQGYEAIIDVADLSLVDGARWFSLISKNAHGEIRAVYAARKVPVGEPNSGSVVLLHRAILCPPPGFEVDHIDGNGLNNRRSNIRVGTISQNQANRRLNRNNTSGFKGVSWHPEANRWRALIHVNRKRIHLGFFTDKELAAAVYLEASQKYFGEFARSE